MSVMYCPQNNLIYTGAHDGTLIAWSFETGYIKQYLHDFDQTCTAKDYIQQSKSVDQILVMDEQPKKNNEMLQDSLQAPQRRWAICHSYNEG
jgi:hypothetical protein